MFKKILSIISVPFFCICLSACSFAGFNPLGTEKSDYANSLSEEQTEESPEPSKASPVYRITKELWDDNTIIEYTYNQDGTLRFTNGKNNKGYFDGAFEDSYDYYANGCVKTIIHDLKGDYILPYCPNHIEIHCDETGAFESVESSVDRETYIEKKKDIPVYEIEVTGKRELSIQGHFEGDGNNTFHYKQRYNAAGTLLIDWELDGNNMISSRMVRILNERGLVEKTIDWNEFENHIKISNGISIYDKKGNPSFVIIKNDDSVNLRGIVFYEDISGTDTPSEFSLDESNAKNLIERYFDAVCNGDSQKAWDYVYRPMRECFDITGEQNEIVSLCNECLLHENEDKHLDIDILQCQKVEDIPLSELENSLNSFFENGSLYAHALIEMNGLKVTANISEADDKNMYETYDIYLVCDGAGESGIFLITY